ncbi:MAG: matrixin family metalloprotease [Acidobacteriota bacterium]
MKIQCNRLQRMTVLFALVLIGLSTGAAMAGYLGSGRFNTRFLDWRFFGTTSANGSYTSPVGAAMSRWTSTTDLQFRQIGGNNWDIAQYVSNFGSTGWAGLAYICATNGACNNSSAWNNTFNYCIAYENRFYMDGYSQSRRQAVSGHEAGHCVSLAHNNNTSSIMYTFISSTGVTNPNSGDRSDVNARY